MLNYTVLTKHSCDLWTLLLFFVVVAVGLDVDVDVDVDVVVVVQESTPFKKLDSKLKIEIQYSDNKWHLNYAFLEMYKVQW